MDKDIISENEYEKHVKKTRYLIEDINILIDTYKYLENKKLFQNEKVYDNAHLIFLQDLFFKTKSDRLSGFNNIDEEFLKSVFLSDRLKKEIYFSIKDYNCSNEIKELLNGNKHFNDFTKDEIEEIMNIIPNNELLHYVIDDYLFELDGLGAVQYIKEKYQEKLPIELLDRSNVVTSASYYSGYGVNHSLLGDGHLFSLYKKFVKYYPDKVDEFLKLINCMDMITPTGFINNYMTFVWNGLDSNFMMKEGNFSIDDVHGNQRDAIGFISLFSIIGKTKKELEMQNWFDKRSSDEIKRDFEQKIMEYNESQGYTRKLNKN